MQGSEAFFPLFSLPALPFLTVVNSVNQAHKLSLARTCRKAAKAVSSLHRRSKVTVTYNTRWEGLRKVLAARTMQCKAMVIEGDLWKRTKPVGGNAVDVLLKPEAVPGCIFKGIKILEIKDVSVPCLVPPNLAQLLPDLQQLYVMRTECQSACPKPLPDCSSLQKLSIIQHADLLGSYSAHELRQRLPNITTLEAIDIHVCKMLTAWGSQLKALDIRGNATYSTIQHCSRLQSLKLGELLPQQQVPHAFLLTALTSLNISWCIPEASLETIFHLRSLCVVSFAGFGKGISYNNTYRACLQQDWSEHECKWQQLTINKVNMVDLGKLPLRSLKGEGGLHIQELYLPDPRILRSLGDVTYAAQRVRDAGLVIQGCSQWQCAAWKCSYRLQNEDVDDVDGVDDGPVDAATDVTSADMFRKASSVVRPECPCLYLYETLLSDYPRTAAALVSWSSPVLQHLSMQNNYARNSPWFWQALQGCNNLNVMILGVYGELSNTKHMDEIRDCTLHVAEIFVAAQNRSVMLIYQGHSGENAPPHCEWEPEQFDRGMNKLRPMLEEKLPTSVVIADYKWDRLMLSPVWLQKQLPGDEMHYMQAAAAVRGFQQTDVDTWEFDSGSDNHSEPQPEPDEQVINNGEDDEGWIQVKRRRASKS